MGEDSWLVVFRKGEELQDYYTFRVSLSRLVESVEPPAPAEEAGPEPSGRARRWPRR
ncbi:hypothetical protein [Streptomyces sp. NPDC052225]|uniref:hypothetical protein n=1 Tax=Streptomyces sp. NPDC052225 TaxID=3154949 RepID=UPI0034408BA4